ncbi:P-loop containing nucleoside triphosphate hydrolase protein [Xylaria digitata]|nr:P-loop containing nucleoside triphosphate hydrolase protein [Xylaria digitata]
MGDYVTLIQQNTPAPSWNSNHDTLQHSSGKLPTIASPSLTPSHVPEDRDQNDDHSPPTNTTIVETVEASLSESREQERSTMVMSLKEADDETREEDEHATYMTGLKKRWNPDLYSLEERRKKSSLRMTQSVEFVELIEDRLAELEKRMRKALREKTPHDDDNDSANAIPPSHNTFNVLKWAEFSTRVEVDEKSKNGRWRHRPEMDKVNKSVVEILVDAPQLLYFWKANRTENQERIEISSSGQVQATESVTLEPYQIRIRSQSLLKELKDITGYNTDIGRHRHRLTLIRPFKLLVTSATALQEHLDMLDGTSARNSLGQDLLATKQALQLPAGSNIPTPKDSTTEVREHLRVLCNVARVYLQPQIQLQNGLSPEIPKITFSDLWYVFRSGFEVRSSGQSQIQLYRVLNVTCGREGVAYGDGPPRPASNKLANDGWSSGSFVIECFYIHFDGARFGPVNKTFHIPRFEKEKDIRTLPIYPIQCDPDAESIRKRLEERGDGFTKLSSSKVAAHRTFKGLTLDSNREQVDSEVIIDFGLSYYSMKDTRPKIGLDDLIDDDKREFTQGWMINPTCGQAGCCGNDIVFDDYEVDEKERRDFRENSKHLFESRETDLTDDHKRLLPPMVYGFVLRTRRWATFDIDELKVPNYENSNWDDLVIEKETKDTVLALVANHERPIRGADTRIDGVLSSVELVQGKGRGLIILLHGEPGVGKTSTAECVAAYTKRPLFPITCGDIGDKAIEVEENLEKNFQLAHKWGCVLLLDEADIFLSTRSEQSNIQHNAIVSIFLRSLEYYSGILFLTTNRVGKIDRAFMSRIHLSLYYPRLDKEKTLSIWRNNLKRVKIEFLKEKNPIDIDEESIMRFAKHHFKRLNQAPELTVWNGRQIRNAFQTAIAMATFQAQQLTDEAAAKGIQKQFIPTLSDKRFREVARSALQFEKYLAAIEGGKNHSEVALDWKWRDDEFNMSDKSDSDEDSSEAERKRSKKRKNRHRGEKSRKRKETTSYKDEESSTDASSE